MHTLICKLNTTAVTVLLYALWWAVVLNFTVSLKKSWTQHLKKPWLFILNSVQKIQNGKKCTLITLSSVQIKTYGSALLKLVLMTLCNHKNSKLVFSS